MLNIGIVGAGIGGLTAAIALRQRDFDVTVYEQAPELSEIGAGLTLATEGCRVLNALGLQQKLDALEEPMPHIGTLHYKTAERLSYDERDVGALIEQRGTATRQVHRADLHALLVDACEREGCALQLGHRLRNLSQDAAAVTLQFDNGESARHDLVIGCDGLKSVVRDACFNTQPPTYTGLVAWRGLVDRFSAADIALEPHFAAVPGEGKLFVRYPLRRGTLINYVAIVRQADFHEESWTARADLAELLPMFIDWHESFYRIISATPTDQSLRWALYSREPLDSWLNGRVALLGDAAHPMTPFYGRGATLACEDGYVLARALEQYRDDWRTALSVYEAARLEYANRVHRISEQRGNAYLSEKPDERAQAPAAGMDDTRDFDAVSTPLPSPP